MVRWRCLAGEGFHNRIQRQGGRPARVFGPNTRRTPMPPDGEINRWLRQRKEGDRSTTRELWQRYFARLVALARQRLRGAPRRAADEEDVALSAFDSFCRNA